jgi:hypothetical protein
MPVANVRSMTVAAHLFDVSEVTRATTLRGDRIQGLNLRVDVLDGKVGRLALASQLASRDNELLGLSALHADCDRRTDCPLGARHARPRAAQNDASAGSRTERRTGDMRPDSAPITLGDRRRDEVRKVPAPRPNLPHFQRLTGQRATCTRTATSPPEIAQRRASSSELSELSGQRRLQSRASICTVACAASCMGLRWRAGRGSAFPGDVGAEPGLPPLDGDDP